MPARRLDDHPVAVRRHDVFGQDSESEPHFVRHAGLITEEHPEVTHDVVLPLVDMGPPLAADNGSVHSVGSVPLTPDEIAQVDLFIDRAESEYRAARAGRRQQYTVLPHCSPLLAPDGTVVCQRFSCGGFVIEAYRFAGIDLITTDAGSLPPVGVELLRLAYPDQHRTLDNPRLRTSLGLDGDGPWPIVLSGYLLHSLARDEAGIRGGPYHPQPGDEYYPARPSPPPGQENGPPTSA